MREGGLLSLRGVHHVLEGLDDALHARVLVSLVPAMLGRVVEQPAVNDREKAPREVAAELLLQLRARPRGRGVVLEPLHEVAQVREADILVVALVQEAAQGGGAVVELARAGLVDGRDGGLRQPRVALVGNPLRLGARALHEALALDQEELLDPVDLDALRLGQLIWVARTLALLLRLLAGSRRSRSRSLDRDCDRDRDRSRSRSRGRSLSRILPLAPLAPLAHDIVVHDVLEGRVVARLVAITDTHAQHLGKVRHGDSLILSRGGARRRERDGGRRLRVGVEGVAVVGEVVLELLDEGRVQELVHLPLLGIHLHHAEGLEHLGVVLGLLIRQCQRRSIHEEEGATAGRVELHQPLDRSRHLAPHAGPHHLLLMGGELLILVQLVHDGLESRRRLVSLLLSPLLEVLRDILLLLQLMGLDTGAGAGALARLLHLPLRLGLGLGRGIILEVAFHGGRLLPSGCGRV